MDKIDKIEQTQQEHTHLLSLIKTSIVGDEIMHIPGMKQEFQEFRIEVGNQIQGIHKRVAVLEKDKEKRKKLGWMLAGTGVGAGIPTGIALKGPLLKLLSFLSGFFLTLLIGIYLLS